MLTLWLACWWTIAVGADIRGMTVSTPTWGWEWGTDAMARTLDELRRDGVNWVAIHPYARIEGDGTVRFRPWSPEAAPDWLSRPIREAHARGMKVLVKPHLAYWGSPFGWRGDIHFDEPEARERFFRTYRDWMVSIAAAVGDADALCVGTELDRLVAHEAEWRGVIEEVRGRYPGPLTYAANWDKMDTVPFWDAVDVIGVQAYFPLLSEGAPVTEASLAHAWGRVMGELRALGARHGKHVVFTELGYDAATHAPVEPWRGSRDQQAVHVQQACLRAALRAIDGEPTVIGAFLWKWFPGELQRGDFRMSSPPMRETIRALWSSGGVAPWPG